MKKKEMEIKNIIKKKDSKGIIVIIQKGSGYNIKYNERMEFDSRKHFNRWLKFNKERSERRRERIQKSYSLK